MPFAIQIDLVRNCWKQFAAVVPVDSRMHAMRLDITFKAEIEEKAREYRPAAAMWTRQRGVNQIARLPTRGIAGKPLGSVETQSLASSPVLDPKGCCGVTSVS